MLCFIDTRLPEIYSIEENADITRVNITLTNVRYSAYKFGWVARQCCNLPPKWHHFGLASLPPEHSLFDIWHQCCHLSAETASWFPPHILFLFNIHLWFTIFRLPGTLSGLVPMTSRPTGSLFGFQDHLSATAFGQLENLTTTMYQFYETLFSWSLMMGQNKLWCLSITHSPTHPPTH